MRYNDAIRFIYNLELFGIKMGLGNITRMLQHLGNPQNSFKSIHIAGTNGKGSVASMLFSILSSAGYRTGVFTSPHLVDFRERFRTNEGHIDKRSVARFIEENGQFIRDARITFFEISTALAFWYFRKMNVDIAIAEVGLGGRLDATNILNPILSVITNIDYDHTKILGTTLEKITIEKAGIIKRSVPVITSVRGIKIYRLLKDICEDRKTTIYRSAAPAKRFEYNGKQMIFSLNRNSNSSLRVKSSLIGLHQVQNATLVAKCMQVLNQNSLNVPDKAVIRGLRDCRWPARFQVISSRPLIILDVAHNPSGADYLARSFKIAFPGRKAILVCGFLERPDYDLILKHLRSITRRAIITRPDNRRAAEIEGVIWAAVNAGYDFDVKLKVADAVDRALLLARKDDIILICGSHFSMGEAITRLNYLRSRGKLASLSADITYMNDNT